MMIGGYQVSRQIFQMIDSIWGPHTVERFANSFNNKLSRFNSLYWDIGSEAVDALTVNWQGENNYFCPPVYLIPKVLHHAMKYLMCLTLIPGLFVKGKQVVLNLGARAELDTIEDPRLQKLVENLKLTVMGSRASSTVTK
uniref:Uncharacterized protein n=1 Tax=Amphimedon queenslandica TaxID=400682 RepID=A0A1X7T0W6_AMPQE